MAEAVNLKRKPEYNKMVSLLDYNSLTGIFTWKDTRRGKVKIGDVAGCKHKSNGYIYIKLDNVDYSAHRLAFYYTHKYYPENEIDHINRVRDDNRSINLREVSYSCQSRNSKLSIKNTSGIKGVCWAKVDNKWHAYIWANGKSKSLGYYNSFDDAVYARYDGEQALGWKGCEANSPAYKYVQQMLGVL